MPVALNCRLFIVLNNCGRLLTINYTFGNSHRWQLVAAARCADGRWFHLSLFGHGGGGSNNCVTRFGDSISDSSIVSYIGSGSAGGGERVAAIAAQAAEAAEAN